MAVYDKNGRIIKSSRKPIKSGLASFNKAIERKYNGTSPNGAGQYYLDWKYNLADEKDYIEQLADKNGLSVEFQTGDGYFEVFSSRRNSMKQIKSVYDDRTGKDDYETKWEYVDELCDRAIKAMDGDMDAMFFNSHLNDNGFVIKGKYIDMIEDNHSSWGYGVPNDLWQDVCKSLAMDKLARITKATKRYNGQLEVDWTGNGLMNSLNRNENSLRAVFGK